MGDAATYTVGHANVHNAVRGARTLRGQGCDSFSLNEANRLTARLLRMRRYRAVYNAYARDRRRGSKANVLMVRRKFRSWGQLTIQASEQVKPTRWAPDRWISVDMFATPVGKLAHVSVHANAVVTGRPMSVPRVREYDEYMRTLNRVLRFVRREGFIPIVSGDFNLRRKDADVQAFLTPYALFSRHDMAVKSVGVDGVAFGRELVPVSAPRVLSRKRLGSDHRGLVVTLRRR